MVSICCSNTHAYTHTHTHTHTLKPQSNLLAWISVEHTHFLLSLVKLWTFMCMYNYYSVCIKMSNCGHRLWHTYTYSVGVPWSNIHVLPPAKLGCFQHPHKIWPCQFSPIRSHPIPWNPQNSCMPEELKWNVSLPVYSEYNTKDHTH